MRINYVLIDFESVQPDSLELLAQDPFRTVLFLGATQSKLPTKIAVAIQSMGDRAQYVVIAGNGPNALDFHIAFYIGRMAAADNSAFFHVISKDTGFDPLLAHLKGLGILSHRHTAIADIPLLKPATSAESGHGVEAVLTQLAKMKAARPRKVNTLKSTIAAVFQKKITEAQLDYLIQDLQQRKWITVDTGKVTYTLPTEA